MYVHFILVIYTKFRDVEFVMVPTYIKIAMVFAGEHLKVLHAQLRKQFGFLQLEEEMELPEIKHCQPYQQLSVKPTMETQSSSFLVTTVVVSQQQEKQELPLEVKMDFLIMTM